METSRRKTTHALTFEPYNIDIEFFPQIKPLMHTFPLQELPLKIRSITERVGG